MTNISNEIRFVDPGNPPPGLDLGHLPTDVDVNELIVRELVSEGELLSIAGEDDGTSPVLADQRATVAVVQEIVDSHCFDPGNPEP